MTRFINIALLGSIIALTATGCATVHKIDSTKMNVIPAPDLISDPAKYRDVILKAFGEGKEVVIFVKAGQSIPLEAKLETPIAKLQAGTNNMVFTRDVYMLISGKKFMIGPDGQQWAEIQDLKAQQQIFGSQKGGSFMIGFGVTKEGPKITLVVTKN